MIKYLFSNIDKINGFNEQQIKYLSKDLKNSKSILFVPGDYDKEKYIIYKDKIISWFNNINIYFKESYLANFEDELKAYDVIFLMGGNPINQIEIIKNINLKKIINKASLVIGVSAGAINSSNEAIYYNDYNEKIENYKGLGLTNINVYPHFDINNNEFVKEVKMVSKIKSLIALPNDSFIRIDNKSIELVGDCFKVDKEKVTKINYTRS